MAAILQINNGVSGRSPEGLRRVRSDLAVKDRVAIEDSYLASCPCCFELSLLFQTRATGESGTRFED
jgi:hypothetical protein